MDVETLRRSALERIRGLAQDLKYGYIDWEEYDRRLAEEVDALITFGSEEDK